ncbi:cytochrome P450 [Aspergillus cavernicola]|uniref:Cytochrome P450 n=1 Tax=Aspergillus cavernicola TaxID=176166 RepID=A0ABR4I1Z7_9EURO
MIWQFAVSVAAAAVIQFLWITVSRLFFHPLARVPGPLFARASYLYSFWYNLGGQFYLRIDELHGQYGPIVRITPNEVHLSDPENCEKIYFVGSRFAKDPAFYDATGVPGAAFATSSPDIHRMKRSAMNPFFSRKMLLDLEGIIHEKAQKLVVRMKKAFDSTGGIDLHNAFRAISIDVITDYAFDDCYNFLDDEAFGLAFINMVRKFAPTIWFFQQFPFLQGALMNAPAWFVKLTSPALTNLMLHHEGSYRQIVRIKEAVDRGEKPNRATIFHQLLQPDATEGYKIPTVGELKDEAFILLSAASDTTGNALTIATYNLARNPDMYARLSAELKERFSDSETLLDFVALEKLPYLTAVIKESLRLSFGVPGRLPRVVPASGAEFNGYHLAPGTVVSMSSWMMHHNEDLYPEAKRFNPERWMDPARAKSLDRYLFSFGKGSRQCVGMPLAYCELYVTLGQLFHQFNGLTTAQKNEEDMFYIDNFSGYYSEKCNEFIFEHHDH